ncbi:Rieske 2Fe-2S domain-containing protein [Nonomuraea sp. NPDC050310]|uniref:cytochrome bc1 complex Rieske iron-sulfur subunit n=1 Tax=unclassified Nonomuraea TaxID=2593643 RepID=UPI0033DF39B9
MTDNEHEIEQPESRVPKRVIGTPAPGTSMLGATAQQQEEDADVPGVILPDEAKARKAEKIVALCFTITFLAAIGFLVSYVVFQVGDIDSTGVSNFALGGTLTLALLGLAVGIVVWVRGLMPKYNLVQERHEMATEAGTREYVADTFVQGARESGFVKRKLLRRTLLLASAPLGLLPLVLLRDLDNNTDKPASQFHKELRHTVWGAKTKEGTNLHLVVEGTNPPQRIRAADFNSPGGILSVVPEGYEHDLNALAKATLILIKFRPEELKAGVNKNWTVDGIVAYSKICTHVGCPAALYEQTTHHILCPCHQSTFDAADGAKVIFGPAARPLPQLPITVDGEGYLIAQGDFAVPVGPSYWERGDAEQLAREGGKA